MMTQLHLINKLNNNFLHFQNKFQNSSSQVANFLTYFFFNGWSVCCELHIYFVRIVMQIPAATPPSKFLNNYSSSCQPLSSLNSC
jgi:myosin-crossreactive antigen